MAKLSQQKKGLMLTSQIKIIKNKNVKNLEKNKVAALDFFVMKATKLVSGKSNKEKLPAFEKPTIKPKHKKIKKISAKTM